jgi:hypothetical protein
MKKLIIAYILLLFLTVPPALAESSLTVKSIISENVHVTFEFIRIEQQLYDEIQTQKVFNASTIPKAIEKYFEQKELKNARVIYDPFQNIFNKETRSIRVELFLTGSDVISSTLNATDMTRTFLVRTDWRNFQMSLTQNRSINLSEHFGDPLNEWQLKGGVFEERRSENGFKMSFRFVLPKNAFDIHAEGDIIVFRVALGFEDSLLNSPFLILGVIIVANVIILMYRRVKK